jgi:hypothetical protein
MPRHRQATSGPGVHPGAAEAGTTGEIGSGMNDHQVIAAAYDVVLRQLDDEPETRRILVGLRDDHLKMADAFSRLSHVVLDPVAAITDLFGSDPANGSRKAPVLALVPDAE